MVSDSPCKVPLWRSSRCSSIASAKCIARVRFSVPTLLPESMRYGDGVDAGVLPPGLLVTDAVQQPVMDAAERNCELIAHLAPQRSRLHVLEVMRVAPWFCDATRGLLARYRAPAVCLFGGAG